MDIADNITLPDLLYHVIPKFTDIAHSLCKDKPHPKNFYVRFEVLLGRFKLDIVSLLCAQTIDEPQLVILEEVAVLLEHLVRPNTLESARNKSNPAGNILAHKYPKLCLLQKCPGSAFNIRFSDIVEDQEYLLKQLQRRNHDLAEELRSRKLEDFIDEDTQHELPELLLEQANKLHKLLSRDWLCSCAVKSRLIHLNLASVHCPRTINRFTKLDILFAASEAPCLWQEGEILFQSPGVKFQGSQSSTDLCEETLQVVKCEGPPCTNNLKPTICQLIEKARQKTARVSIQISGDFLLADKKPHRKEVHVKAREALVFSEITDLLSKYESQASVREMNKLAVVLSYALLHLYDDIDGPLYWLSPNWTNRDGLWKTPHWIDHVRFFYHGRVGPGKLDIQQPYLLTHINGPPISENPPFEDFDDAFHRAPSILALGKALLELQIMHLGLSATLQSSPEGFDDGGEVNVNTELETVEILLTQVKDKLDHWYWKAIDACVVLNPAADMSIQDYIYKKIVRPLEHNYYINSPSPEQVQEQLNDLRAISQAAVVQLPATERTPVKVDVGLYGDDPVSINFDEHRAANQWWAWLQGVQSKVYGPQFEGEKVKIAILDTGLEISDDQSDIYEKDERIIYKSWIGEDEEGYANGKDDIGHGTHLATLLVQVARDARVHVARVFKGRKPDMQTELKNVAKAIRYAVDYWDVDIIVMSFGFEEEQDSEIPENSILRAIRYANDKNVTMFAAASNDGHNRPDGVAWPARAPEVICVHAADGNGYPKFTPPPSDNQRVMVLGACVGSAWPKRAHEMQVKEWEQRKKGGRSLLGPGLQLRDDYRYLSGTSCANAIAGGIGAIVLHYARRFLRREDWQKLRRTEYMRRMFGRMQEKDRTDGYWWILPWDHFGEKSEQGWIEGEIRKTLR